MHLSTTTDIYAVYLEANRVTTDSRSIQKGDLFFALKGPNFNGNEYAQDALNKGAKAVVIDEPIEGIDPSKSFLVEDGLKALQDLASLHRSKFDIPVLGITGSNGKTTTKELIQVVLSKKFKVSCTRGNLNNHIGVPLTLLEIPSDTEIAIVEMGANHMEEIDSYCQWAKPNHALITNIGSAHLEGFGSLENIEKGKTELYRFVQGTGGIIFYNEEDEKLVRNLNQQTENISYNGPEQNGGRVLKTNPTLSFQVQGWKEDIQTQLVGAYNLINALAAVGIGRYFEVADKDIIQAIQSYAPDNNRSQLQKIDSNIFILDAYNANPSSMNAAIDDFSNRQDENKLMILGDMLELGDYARNAHQSIIDRIKTARLNAVFVGPLFGECELGAFEHFENAKAAGVWFHNQNFQDTTILLKGSRGIALEKILSDSKSIQQQHTA